MNKKYYITMVIILIIYVIMIVTGGILIGPTEFEYMDFSGALVPAVMPKGTKILLINILIILMSNVFNIFCVIKDKKNNIKKVGLLFIILLTIFLVPIKIEGEAGYERNGKRIIYNNKYITIWNMIN